MADWILDTWWKKLFYLKGWFDFLLTAIIVLSVVVITILQSSIT